MLELHCYNCGQSFKIENENLYNKIAIQCVNCDNPVPHKAIEALRRFSEAYLDAIDVLHYENSLSNAWGISIVDSKVTVPEEPDRYFHREPKDSYWKHRRKPIEPLKLTIDDSDIPF